MLVLIILLCISNILLIINAVIKTNNIDKSGNFKELQLKNKELEDENKSISKNIIILEERIKYFDEQLNNKIKEYDKIKKEKDDLEKKLRDWEINYNSLESEKNNLNNRLKEQSDFIKESKEKMKMEFENTSNSIIKQQKSDFAEIMLQPIKDQMEEFKKKIEDNNKINIENKTIFEEQIKNLAGKSENLAKEAQDLTIALKGNKKLQGNWGEIQLENLFGITGLNEGVDYIKQETTINEDGKIHRPDFIVNLPEDRRVIIDSKISLNNYLAYISSDNEVDKKKYIKNYMEDIKNHIKNLSSKEYYKELKKSMSLDYVFMFIPLERAYIDIVEYDKSIYSFAFENRIAIITPSSLMPILKTIEHLWNIEKQNKNMEKIINLARRIYEKLVGFQEEMEKIDKIFLNFKSYYYEIMKKIYTGKGNILKTAEEIKKLGVNTNKKLKFNNEEEEDNIEVEYLDNKNIDCEESKE